MKQKVYTIYDSKLEIYNSPFLALNKGHAIRLITKMVQREDHDFCVHAKDFTMFEIGEYDDSSGRFDLYSAHVPVTGLWELKEEDTQLDLPLKGANSENRGKTATSYI